MLCSWAILAVVVVNAVVSYLMVKVALKALDQAKSGDVIH